MAAFLVFVQLGVWFEDFYVHSYVARALIVPVLLIWLWPKFAKIRWDYWWLGIIVGVVGIVQWIGVEMLVWNIPNWPTKPEADDGFNPYKYFAEAPAWMLGGWLVIRIFTAVVTVSIMEELFWRDYLWRTLIAPADIKLAKVGEYHPMALFLLPVFFAFVHMGWATTSVVWGLMIGGLLVTTRSLGACIIAHSVTNLLLAAYVLYTEQWYWW